MKHGKTLAVVAGAAAVFAPFFYGAYAYYYTDNLTSIDTTKWYQNGAVTATSGGLTATTPNGGSLISKVAVPDGSNEYEVKTTLTLTANGGTYVHYLRATNDAMTGPAAQGTYYSVELQNPTFSGPACSATLAVYKRESGVVTSLGSAVVGCRNGMTMRSVFLSYGSIMAYTDNRMAMYIGGTSSITSGKPGVGALGMPSGNSIARAELGPLDRIGPNTAPATQVSTWVQPNAVDFQVQPPADDANGTGVYYFQVNRNGSFLLQSQSSSFTDANVSPNTTYNYTIWAIDYHNNYSGSTAVSVTTPPAGAIDPRQPGVKPTGSHWGAMGENINMQSGNLNFSYPLVKAEARGGWGATFGLNYNSQNWRKDAAATWKLGQDVGYGFGWKLMAGSVTPYWGDYWNIHHYTFTDATGAEYRLNQNSGGVWTSLDATYVSYDSNTNRLYFNDGSFWKMEAVSSGAEQDAGTRYPTVMQDSNGNQIHIRYKTGVGVIWADSSARLDEIEDVRAVAYGNPVKYRTFSFSYNTDAIPHLTGITNYINTAEGYALSYSAPQTLYSPMSPNGSFGTAQMLNSVTMSGISLVTSFEYGTYGGELTRVVFPYGGDLRWQYRDFEYTGGRRYREVQTRQLTKQIGAATTTYTITRNDAADAGYSVHSEATLTDPGLVGQRKWFFEPSTASADVGLVTKYEEQQLPGPVVKSRQEYTWSADGAGRRYVSRAVQTIDPGAGQKQSKTEQTLDVYGNVTSMQVFGYGIWVNGPDKSYTNTYLSTSPYTTRYIRNRVSSTQVVGMGSSVTKYFYYDSTGVYGGPVNPRQHDTANYGTGFGTRGNLSQTNGPEGIRLHYYDYLGTRTQTSDWYGHYVQYATTSATNFAAPSTITPNGTSSLATSLGYSLFLGLQNVTGPNGASSTISYDSYARPQFTFSPHGAQTSWVYTTSPPTKKGTTNGHWEKTTFDGLGRVIKVERGQGVETKTIVDTEYDSCACSPLGKVKRVSQPYAPGGTIYWTTYTYDGLGRVVSVAHPNATGTSTYSYAGNTVTATDAAGKWKKFETDVFGNLTKVTEPDPAAGNVDTTYTYNLQNQMLQASMTRGGTTQLRTFTYDASWRLATATTPETGTVTYTYNPDNTVATKVDAKNQKVEYLYDGHQRVTMVKRYPVSGGAEDICQRTTNTYDYNPLLTSWTQNAAGRLAMVEWGHETACPGSQVGRWYEFYSYTVAGLVTKKRLRLQRQNYLSQMTTADLDGVYGWNNEGQMTTMTQPGYYTGTPPAGSWNNGAAYTLGYDTMARLTSIQQTAPSSSWVISSMAYGAANQVTSITYGTGQVQTRQYNERLQMTRMTVSGLMDLEYKFSLSANNGQATAMKNHLSGEEVQYTYDSLKRLITADTVGPEWRQEYGYDGFGNLLSKSVTKGSAPAMSVSINPANNRVNGYTYDANGNATVLPATFTLGYDVENRMVSNVLGGGGSETYGYGPDGKRVWRNTAAGQNRVYFYGLNGERQGIYSWGVINGGTGDIGFYLVALESVVPKGLQVDRDRLGSVVSGGLKYDPWGAEFTVTSNERDKFGTYYRDSTGLNYAEQRYYGSTGGRFLSADPYTASAGAADPGSWNRYVYTRGDPVSRNDPNGLQDSETGTKLVYCGPVGYVPREHCEFYVASMNQAGVVAPDAGPFAQDAARLLDAVDALRTRAQFSENCSRGIARIRADLDPWAIVAASGNLNGFADRNRANLTIAEAYGDAAVGGAAQRRWDRDPRAARYLEQQHRNNLTVRDYFEVFGGVAAFTPYRGNVIYIDAGRLNTANANRNQALIMHELLHNEWGLDDGDILDALYGRGSRNNRPSADITEWFERNCVRGGGNN